MRSKSLVVVLPLNKWREEALSNGWDIKWEPVDNEKEVYMLRDVKPCMNTGKMTAIFEEGIIAKNPQGCELGINLEYLREIDEPDELNISALMEETNLTTV